MNARDAFRFINELDEATVRGFIARLEFRGHDPTFARWRDAYLDKLALAPAAAVLDLGCGTGVVARAVARRAGFAGRVVGVDQSPILLGAARRLADDEAVGRAHHLPRRGRRAARPAGRAVRRGDRAHHGQPRRRPAGAAAGGRAGHAAGRADRHLRRRLCLLDVRPPRRCLAATMDAAIIATVANNPRVLRAMPRLLGQVGLARVETLGFVYADSGAGSFYGGALTAYTPLAVRAGLVPADQAAAWLADQREAMAAGTFFGACAYYTYLARKPTSS